MARSARTRVVIGIVSALAIVCALPAVASAAPGQIDTTFGHLGNGTVFSQGDSSQNIVKVLRQPDGKIVTIADSFGSNPVADMAVTRFLPNGSLDPTFGVDGTFSKAVNGIASSGVLQPDGKIVVVGWDDPTRRFFILRLRANGTVDPSFHATEPQWFGSTTVAQASSVALGPSGTIVVAGRSGPNLALARFTSLGDIDNSFSGDGLLIHDFGGQSEADDVAVLPDGRIIVAGTEVPLNASPRNLVARFTATGSLDSTFGTGGRVLTTSSPLQFVQRITLEGTKPVVAGIVDISTAGISRYNANGTIDTTFGTAGTTRTHGGAFTRIIDLTTDGSGRLVASGEVARSNEFPDVSTLTAVFRYSADGTPDPTFGCSGVVLTEMLGNGFGTQYNASVATGVVAAGNDVVVGGFASQFNGTDFPPTDSFVTRFHGDGPHTSGYALLRGDGGTSAFGGAPACGSVAGVRLNRPIVGMAADPSRPATGPWRVTAASSPSARPASSDRRARST